MLLLLMQSSTNLPIVVRMIPWLLQGEAFFGLTEHHLHAQLRFQAQTIECIRYPQIAHDYHAYSLAVSLSRLEISCAMAQRVHRLGRLMHPHQLRSYRSFRTARDREPMPFAHLE